jgi:hypothetical protein
LIVSKSPAPWAERTITRSLTRGSRRFSSDDFIGFLCGGGVGRDRRDLLHATTRAAFRAGGPDGMQAPEDLSRLAYNRAHQQLNRATG